MNLEFAAATYRALHARIRAENPQINEQTLADTVEGLTPDQLGPRTAIPSFPKGVRPSLPDATRVSDGLRPIQI